MEQKRNSISKSYIYNRVCQNESKISEKAEESCLCMMIQKNNTKSNGSAQKKMLDLKILINKDW